MRRTEVLHIVKKEIENRLKGLDNAVDDLEEEIENSLKVMDKAVDDLEEIRDELLKNLDKQSMIGAEGGDVVTVPSLDKENGGGMLTLMDGLKEHYKEMQDLEGKMWKAKVRSGEDPVKRHNQ